MDDGTQSEANRPPSSHEDKEPPSSMSENITSSNQTQVGLDGLPASLGKFHPPDDHNNSSKRIAESKRTVMGLNEPLLDGFVLLRAAQLLNIDVYYIGNSKQTSDSELSPADLEASPDRNVSDVNSCCPSNERPAKNIIGPYRTILDDFASYNPLQKFIDRHGFARNTCRLIKIFLSFMAIIVGFYEMLSTIMLCLVTVERKLDQSNEVNVSKNSGMGLFVLVLVQFSSIYILISTIFNGHLLWNLFSQRQFLVSKRFQYKTMLKLLVFIYLEYIINTSFVYNLYDWSFTSNNIESGSYSMLANLRILVTFKDFESNHIDVLMTIVSFARGILRISPYITINYAIICLEEHINTIRNQRLLTDSLKKRQKLRLVVGKTTTSGLKADNTTLDTNRVAMKKKVNFVTEPINFTDDRTMLANNETPARRQALGSAESSNRMTTTATISELPLKSISKNFISMNTRDENTPFAAIERVSERKAEVNGDTRRLANMRAETKRLSKDLLLERIEDFDELESYITNMYIFTGKLNRYMSSQGLTVFFVVHNLVISVSLIVPEAINGGPIMVHFIRLLLIVIAILPFIVGQSLKAQLAQLSKQIDRIIIQQHFIHHRRDNLVRIRELIHDIRINCGGMLNFNVATGVKYLVVAFASAFFIEQEHYKLTRRHKSDDVAPTIAWVVGFHPL